MTTPLKPKTTREKMKTVLGLNKEFYDEPQILKINKTTREQAKKEFFKHCKFLELGPGEETYLWEGVRKLLEKEQLEEMRWKEVDGYHGKYAISDYGHVKNVITKKSLKLTKNMYGYMITHLSDRDTGKSKGVRVHRLVGRYFIPNPMLKPCINHLDGNKQNNHFSNLEWCTDSENKYHAFKNGLNHGPNKIRIGQYTLDGKLIKEYESMCEASRQTGVPLCEIWRTSSFKPKIGKYLHARGFRWKKLSTLKPKEIK